MPQTQSSINIIKPCPGMTEIKRMPERFFYNGFKYILTDRNDLVALYSTYLGVDLVGFEVVRIYRTKSKERIASDDEFMLDGSHCYFPTELKRARKYFMELSAKLIKVEAN